MAASQPFIIVILGIAGLTVELSSDFELSLMSNKWVFWRRLAIKVGLLVGAGTLELPSRHYLVIRKPYFLTSAPSLLPVVISKIRRLALKCAACNFQLTGGFDFWLRLNWHVQIVARVSTDRLEFPFWHYLVFGECRLLTPFEGSLIGVALHVVGLAFEFSTNLELSVVADGVALGGF